MNNLEETVVAVIKPQTTTGEQELAVQVSDIEFQAEALVISNAEQLEEAGRFGVMLREKMSEVIKFFAPMKKSAHDAHKQVCDREKQMLAPLKNAESMLKKSINEYEIKRAQERRAAEEEARRLAQEEADRKLEESIAAEENGDFETAKTALFDAELADRASRTLTSANEQQKVKGVITTKDWEIESIDLDKVPVSVAGVLIRPVDQSAVMRLIRSSKGQIKIDGIKYRETVKTSFRRS